MAVLALTWHASSQAALTMSTTRVVYDADRRGVSLLVANPSKNVFAAQAWVNTEQDDTTSSVPFVTNPPLFRLDPVKQQQVQISVLPNELAQDRESLFFFNLQEIPQLDDSQANVLAIAMRTRIKLFYRPPALKSGPQQQFDTLSWSLVQADGKRRLAVDNPTPYHVTFSRLLLNAHGKSENINTSAMVRPLSRLYYDLPAGYKQGPMKVEFTTVNDHGSSSRPLTMTVAQPH
ncbi:MAG: fimbrial biogenesis chaperone [Janthinobacterium lividum]